MRQGNGNGPAQRATLVRPVAASLPSGDLPSGEPAQAKNSESGAAPVSNFGIFASDDHFAEAASLLLLGGLICGISSFLRRRTSRDRANVVASHANPAVATAGAGLHDSGRADLNQKS